VAVSGDRCVFSAFNRDRLSYMSGASRTRRLSSGRDILLNLDMSMALLRYPSAKLMVFRQLSWTGFHPCSPPGKFTLLMYIHKVFSSSVNVFFSVGTLLSQCTFFIPGLFAVLEVFWGRRWGGIRDEFSGSLVYV
jgi:hypothetical protein